MKVTPLDLRQTNFKTVMRGYDRGEVNALLQEAADDYENAIRENERLRQEVAKLEAILAEHRGQERNLRNTLVTAQKLADGIQDTATQEAQRILREAEGRADLLLQKLADGIQDTATHEAQRLVREAEGRADLLLQKGQARLEDIQREIDGLRMKRREVETGLESLIATLQNTIAFVREQDNRHREEKILLHRPKQADAPAGVQAEKLDTAEPERASSQG